MSLSRSLACTLVLGLVVGCGDAREAPLTDFTVRLRDPAGDPIGNVVALITTGDAPPVARTISDSVVSVDVTLPVQLTFKAQGFERATYHIAAATTGTGDLTLIPVAAPTATADYATGFAADASGAAAFAALATTFPSELGRAQVVKFYVDQLASIDGSTTTPVVYFQNTTKHPLHYDFYRDVLGHAGTRRAFEDATYHGQGRLAAAGTLIAYPDLQDPVAAPVALTFFPSDDLEPALALRIQQLIEARMPFLDRADGTSALTYLPAGDVQEAATRAEATTFTRAGQRWVSHTELYGGLSEQRLNPGVAFGTLRRLTPEELETTVVSFRDVLVLTRLPNELPIVGGTITEELQTPLAHVNVAARARGTPNLSLLGAGDDPTIAPLVGSLVHFEVTDESWSMRAATLAEAEAFWSGHVHEPWSPEADVTTDGLPAFADLAFADARMIGVKAANLAELHNLLPDVAPNGFAVPFHHYDHFMATSLVTAALCTEAHADCLEEGRTAANCDAAKALCVPEASETLYAHVDRLLADATFKSDSGVRDASLDSVRWLIRHSAVDPTFAAALDARIAEVLGPNARVRLRSSTNAEDLPEFSGAGLYDSYGADASGDDRASLEIRKVWASVWNWRAVEERSFWGIDHRAVRMGVAVHPSFPDEQANGVMLTVNVADPTVAGFYVNVQKGEIPVTNPVDGAVPEVFSIVEAPGGGVQVIRQRFSTLSPDVPLMTDAEVAALYAAAAKIQRHFAPLYDADPFSFALDLEFKLHGPSRALVIKQARPYHDPSGAGP